MENKNKFYPLYILKILYELTDENNSLTASEVVDILEKEYGIKTHHPPLLKIF